MDVMDYAKKGDLEFFKEAPPDILLNARDSNGDTVLSFVVYRNRLDCCEVICKRCPSLLYQQTRRGGNTPLHSAASRGNLDILEILITTCDKADQEEDRAGKQKTLTLTTTNGSNAMHKAVYGGQPKCIKLLIEADPNKELLKAGDRKKNTPLHLAVENSDREIISLLIKADPDFDYGVNSYGETPLLIAIDKAELHNEREMLKLVLELQPTQTKVSVNENGWTALHYSVSKKYLHTIEYIIQSCPESSKVADNEGRNFFHHAVNSGNVYMVKHILGMKEITPTVLNSPDKLGRTPWDVAAVSGNESMILCLHENPGVNKKLTVTKNLQWIVKKHNFGMMNRFLKTNADLLTNIELEVFLNSKDEEGDTILFKAAQENHLFLCEKLYKRCPTLIYHQSKDGRTALHNAAWKGEPQMLKFLIAAGAKSYNEHAEDDIESGGGERNPQKKLLTMLDDHSDTALHWAVQNHKLVAVKLLVEADPDYEYCANISGETPIMISVREARSNENKYDSGKIRKFLFEKQPSQTMAQRGQNGWTLLHQATSDGDLSIIEDIIMFCSEYLVVKDNEDKNFLHIAAELGNVEVVRQVLRAKDIPFNVLNGKDDEGKNFLHIAAELEKVEVVKQVLRAKDIIKVSPSCLEQVDNKGQNFLHIAAELGNVEVVRQILRAKHIPPVVLIKQDNEGKNLLHIAAEFEKIEVVKIILRDKDIPKEGVLDKKDNDGNTPFHIAALTGNEPLTRCFLFHDRVHKDTRNIKPQHVLSEIKFPYDKRKAGVLDIAHTVDQSDLKDQRELDLLVVALIATVSFSAGITVPGGYNSDKQNQGTAVLSKEASFAAFIISNTFALIFSLYAVISHFCARRMSDEADINVQLIWATFCTLAAIYCMMAAFIAGSFAVLANSDWLPIVVCIISGLFCISACYPIYRMQCKRAAPASQHTRSSVIQGRQSSQAVEASVARQFKAGSPGSNATGLGSNAAQVGVQQQNLG